MRGGKKGGEKGDTQGDLPKSETSTLLKKKKRLPLGGSPYRGGGPGAILSIEGGEDRVVGFWKSVHRTGGRTI